MGRGSEDLEWLSGRKELDLYMLELPMNMHYEVIDTVIDTSDNLSQAHVAYHLAHGDVLPRLLSVGPLELDSRTSCGA